MPTLSQLFATPLRFYLFALFVSAVALLSAHGFEKFGHLAPCLLCLDQREVHWLGGAFALGLSALYATGQLPRFWLPGLILLTLIYLYGGGLAFFHAGVEWKFWPGPAACAAQSVEVIDNSGSISLDMQNIHIGPSCDEAAWRFLGLSMAGWNGLICLMVAGIMLWGLRKFGLHHRHAVPMPTL